MTVWWEGCHELQPHRRIWCINGEETIPPCVFFLFPKREAWYTTLLIKGTYNLSMFLLFTRLGGGRGREYHFTLPKTPLKILLSTKFLIYGFTTRKHQGHTQMPWNFPWLSLTVLSSHFHLPDIQFLGEKEELGLHTLFLIMLPEGQYHPVSSAKSSLCVLLARCTETNICLCVLLARYTETNICHGKM